MEPGYRHPARHGEVRRHRPGRPCPAAQVGGERRRLVGKPAASLCGWRPRDALPRGHGDRVVLMLVTRIVALDDSAGFQSGDDVSGPATEISHCRDAPCVDRGHAGFGRDRTRPSRRGPADLRRRASAIGCALGFAGGSGRGPCSSPDASGHGSAPRPRRRCSIGEHGDACAASCAACCFSPVPARERALCRPWSDG